jgi:hypothetical protein
MSADDERAALAQVIANSLWAMQSGYTPTEAWEIPTPNGGDDALAADILAAGFRRQGPITDAQVEAAATQMYAIEHLGESRLPDDWEGALFKRRARAVLESAREAS